MSPELLDVPADEAQLPNFMGNLSGALILGRLGSIEGTRVGEVRGANSVGMKLVWIPSGSFTMGSPEGEKDRSTNENKVSVKLTQGFWMSQTEVTQGQWRSLMGTEPWKGKDYVEEGANHAASWVSGEDASAYMTKLTDRERRSGLLPLDWEYKLPSEAEWEYACRGGTPTSFSFGEYSFQLSKFGWFTENTTKTGERFAHEVGERQANAWGLHDMHGNVYEWCRDVYIDNLAGGTNPIVENGGSFRVYRGGSWNGSAGQCRSANRSRGSPVSRSSLMGFRVSLVPASK